MKKTWITYGMIAVFMVSLIGCGKTKVAYSNLADQKSQAEWISVLEEDEIPKEPMDQVLTWVNEFNQITQSYEPVKGFQALPEKGVDYSTLLLDDTKKSYSYLQWLNCRLTAFFLLRDQIETVKTGEDSDNWLMFDIEAIDTVPEFKMTKEDRADFITLFHQVSVSGTSTLEEHEEKIQEAWKKRNIKILNNKVSLVCVYMHAPEDEARFVGHTGVLAKCKDGFLFFEKYGNLAPFQATRFQSREELKQYLLSRSDLYGDETELEPIITENGEIL